LGCVSILRIAVQTSTVVVIGLQVIYELQPFTRTKQITPKRNPDLEIVLPKLDLMGCYWYGISQAVLGLGLKFGLD